MIKNRINKFLWLFQQFYVEKIVNQFLKSLKKQIFDTLMIQIFLCYERST